jgi:hypothetical protein
MARSIALAGARANPSVTSWLRGFMRSVMSPIVSHGRSTRTIRSVATPPLAVSWSTPGEAVRLCFRRRTLRRTLTIAAVVGTILSLVNQASVIAGGDATVVTWVRVGANYLTPFCVSTAGFLTGTRQSHGLAGE